MAKRKGVKVKVLFADTNSIFSMKEKEVKEGKLVFDKEMDFDVDKVPHQTIQYSDKMLQMVALFGGVAVAAVLMLTMGYEYAMVGFLAPLVIQKLMFDRKILFPFYFLRWNSATPYNIASAKPTRRFSIGKKVSDDPTPATEVTQADGKKFKIKEKGTLDVIELKLDEPATGLKVYKPQVLKLMSKNTALETALRMNFTQQKDWIMLIVFLGLGLMLGLYLQPQLAAMAAQNAAAAVPPPS